MAHSRFKIYKVFSSDEEVTEPFYHVRTLSNGDKIGKAVVEQDIEGALDNYQIVEYISNNHIEEEDII